MRLTKKYSLKSKKQDKIQSLENFLDILSVILKCSKEYKHAYTENLSLKKRELEMISPAAHWVTWDCSRQKIILTENVHFHFLSGWWM